MIKVAIVTNIPSPYRVDLYNYLHENVTQYDFNIIYTSENESNRAWNVNKENLKKSYILKSKVIKLKGNIDDRYVHIPGNMSKLLNQINPDVVIAMEYNPAAIQSLVWCKVKKKKFIHLTDGTLVNEQNLNIVQKLSRKIICRNADSFIASSTKAKEKLISYGVPAENIFISLLTVNLEDYKRLNREPEQGRILYVGSFVKRKGLDLLIESLKYVTKPFELRIVGGGTEEDKKALEALIIKNNLESKVCWCGYKSGQNLYDEYSKAEIFVLPTREDCFGLVLLEAFASKIPIVSSKYADGCYDIVIDGENGYIADPFDSNLFAEKINNALNNIDLQSHANINNIEKFEFSNTVKGYMDAMKNVENKY